MKFTASISFVFIFSFAISQTPVREEKTYTIGGIKQFVRIEGKSDTLPLLLFLHGGPGGSVMNSSHKWTNKLKEHFIVVQWDQRETGKTLELNPSNYLLRLRLFQDDTHDIIDSLLAEFHQEKLYLVGHSWGTVLGFHMARNFPEKLHAFVAVGAMINQLESERTILALMKQKAIAENNSTASRELETVKIPFENGEQLFFHRKWLFDYVGSNRKLDKEYVLNWSTTWLKLFNEASATDLNRTTPELKCPIYFFVGHNDYQTNSLITKAYFEKLIAPEKDLIWFEKSAHGIPTSEPVKFQEIIIDEVLNTSHAVENQN